MPSIPKFCKIFIGAQDDFLRIPKEFKQRYDIDLPGEAYLKVPGGLLWDVELVYNNVSADGCDELLMKEGWVRFRDHYSVTTGHFLVFQYDGSSTFDVVIFDMMGSEIKYHTNGAQHVQNVPPRFHKILVDLKLESLRIPEEFTGKYGNDLPNAVFFKVPCGKSIEVELNRNEVGEIWLGKGWKEFRDLHSISFGQTLVFQYDNVSRTFEVWIFGWTAVEIDYLHPDAEETRSECEIFRCDHADIVEGGSSIDRSMCTVEIRCSNLHSLRLPNEFSQANPIKSGMEVILQNVEGKGWNVRVVSKDGAALCSGWKKFLVDNNVVVGTIMSLKMSSRSENVIETRVVKIGPKPEELMEYVTRRLGRYSLDAYKASRSKARIAGKESRKPEQRMRTEVGEQTQSSKR